MATTITPGQRYSRALNPNQEGVYGNPTAYSQASVRAVDNAIAVQTKAQIQTEIARLEDRLRIARNGLAGLNPNLQDNQAIIARYKNEVATIPDQIKALKVKLAPEPPPRKSGIVAQQVVRGGIIVEENPPVSSNRPVPGQPSTPTTENYCKAIDYTNSKRSHVCDFKLEMLKDINLSKYTKAIANTIREAIRKILAALGLSDSSGQSTYWVNLLKNIARELRDFNKYVIKPIIEFEKYVLAYITKLREIIAWILSLPAALAKLLADCLARLRKLIVSVFTSIIASAAAVGTGADPNAGDAEAQAGGFYGGPGFAEVIAEAKDAVAAAGEVLNKVGEAAQLAATIPITATAGLLVPTTLEEVYAADATIQAYEKEKNITNNSAVLAPQFFDRPPNLLG
jgi:hypothetical protein